MGQKILSILTRDPGFTCLEIDRQNAGPMPAYPPLSANRETLAELCRRADEICLSLSLPTAYYAWEPFPRVAKRHLPKLVEQNARTRLGDGGTPVVKVYPEPPREEEDRHLVPFLAVPENDLEPFWQLLGPHFRKVRFIGPLALSLAALVAECEKPAETFLVAWIGNGNIEIVIASPEGMVKVARSVPCGSDGSRELEEGEQQRLSLEVTREIATTQTFFKQQFRKLPPPHLYLLAQNRIAPAFANFPVTIAGLTVTGLSRSPCVGRSPAEIADCAPLLGALFVHPDLSLLPPDYLHYRKTRKRYDLLIAALLLAALGSAGWFYSLHRENLALKNDYERGLESYQRQRDEVIALQREIRNLEPLRDWQRYYHEVYQARPRWNRLLTELARQTDDAIIIDEWGITPDPKVSNALWRGRLKGRVRAAGWQRGLEQLRRFGTRLEASHWFKVIDLNYQPRELTAPGAKIFTFRLQISIRNENRP